jgi:hypothetical protein
MAQMQGMFDHNRRDYSTGTIMVIITPGGIHCTNPLDPIKR